MTWFVVPPTQSKQAPAFTNADGCTHWLAQQPLANPQLMHQQLLEQLEKFNLYTMAPRERFKTLETLRKTIFTVQGDTARRFEFRALPLTTERDAYLQGCALWQEFAVGYLHCLRACLNGDDGVVKWAPKIVHRAISTLRMEMGTHYRAGYQIYPEQWNLLHAIYTSAEMLGVTTIPVTDWDVAETRESTVHGQYVMALLLHLARPGELGRNALSAVSRWLARWRERGEILLSPPGDDRSGALEIDLASEQPFASGGSPETRRWLDISSILRRVRHRITYLKEGQSPEELKLGKGLTPEQCIAMLERLQQVLTEPVPAFAVAQGETQRQALLVVGLEAVHWHLAGQKVAGTTSATSTMGTLREQEQIAVFGRIIHDPNTALKNPQPQSGQAGPGGEVWQLLAQTTAELWLRRPPQDGNRISLRALASVCLPGEGMELLGIVQSLEASDDGALTVRLQLIPGTPRPVTLLARERNAAISRYPAFRLPELPALGRPQSIVVPTGVSGSMATSFSIDEPNFLVKLGDSEERGADFERLQLFAA